MTLLSYLRIEQKLGRYFFFSHSLTVFNNREPPLNGLNFLETGLGFNGQLKFSQPASDE